MSPRPYRLGQRQATTDQTRTRILAAARELLAAAGGIAGFTVEAVARHADVSRMTVYYQFGSKAGLLEALFDQLATTGRLPQGAVAALNQPTRWTRWPATSPPSAASGPPSGWCCAGYAAWPPSTRNWSRGCAPGMCAGGRGWSCSPGGWPTATATPRRARGGGRGAAGAD